ncbi:hypothetical protein GSI_08613 [Ganoderma sinense ZZ0214-1]|uniref:Uncharacterized protein n=1 Tax=Ganoderma sinense ZZ0214-1 TaxID=1077348 RepID=A0A2G8S477_9APHY|nr:hypothetical protein GSI_08613 [Ganoderma sinense ZZ0214-1]
MGTIVGIAVGSGAVAVLLAILSFLYGKNRALVARAGDLTGSHFSLLESSPNFEYTIHIGVSPSSDDRRDRSGRVLVEDVETQANNMYPTGPTMMVRRASSIRSSAQIHAEPLPDFHGEDVVTEKRLLELTRQRDRYRVVTTSSGRDGNGSEQLRTRAAPIVEEPISAPPGRDLRHEMDGGRRLAGGRPGEPVTDDLDHDAMSEGSTLPPPYSSHFGEM